MKNKFVIGLVCGFALILPAICADLSVKSDVQHYSDAKNKIELQGNVEVKYNEVNIASPKAEVLFNKDTGKAEKVEFQENVYSYKISKDTKHEIKAKVLEMSLLNKIITADGNTQSVVLKGQKPTIIVTADKQEFDSEKNIMSATGGVIIYYNDAKAYGDYAQVNLNKNNEIQKILISGNSSIKQNESIIKGDKFEYFADTEIIKATGNVYSDINEPKITLKVKSNYQEYNKRKNIIIAQGNTVVNYMDYQASGPKATVFPDNTGKLNTVIFVGRSKIQQENRSIEADKITLTMNPKDFQAEGNVQTLIKGLKDINN